MRPFALKGTKKFGSTDVPPAGLKSILAVQRLIPSGQNCTSTAEYRSTGTAPLFGMNSCELSFEQKQEYKSQVGQVFKGITLDF